VKVQYSEIDGIDLTYGDRIVVETERGNLVGTFISWYRSSGQPFVSFRPDDWFVLGMPEFLHHIPFDKVSLKPDARDKEIERLQADYTEALQTISQLQNYTAKVAGEALGKSLEHYGTSGHVEVLAEEVKRLRAENEQLKPPLKSFVDVRDEQLEETIAQTKKAMPRALGIFTGSLKPRMCIPPQADDDDILIIGLLNKIPDLVAEVKRLRGVLDELPKTIGEAVMTARNLKSVETSTDER
jgi:hypothetical protein